MDILRIGWDVLEDYCELVASKMCDDGYAPDCVIALSRGGLVPGRILVDILGIRTLSVMGLTHYFGMGKREKKPKVTQDLGPDLGLAGKKVLLVDDVADSGKTLEFVKKLLVSRGAKTVRVATIHYKPSSTFEPDYYAAVSDSWIVYPWEKREAENELAGKKR